MGEDQAKGSGFKLFPLTKALLLGLLTGILGLATGPSNFILGIEENMGLGLLFKLRGPIQTPPDAVVVSIDRESSENLNLPDNPDKWPRSIHARLTENMMREGASVVAYDVHFIEERSPVDDNLFAKAMKKAGNVVLCEPIKEKEIPLSDSGGAYALGHNIVQLVPPIDLFSNACVSTAPFTLPRIPFKVNKYWIFETGAGDSPTIPIVALQLFSMEVYEDFVRLLEKVSPKNAGKLPRDRDAALEKKSVKELILEIREIFENEPFLADRMREELESSSGFLGDAKKHRLLESLIKMYGGATSRYINFYGPPGSITTIPYYQALQLHDGSFDGRQIDVKGKAVFVGLSEVLLADRKDSFYTVFSRANGTFIGGVEIMATAFSNLLSDTPVKPVSLPYYILIILFWGLIVGVTCRVSNVGVAALAVAGMSILYLLTVVYQFKTNYSWLPVVVPLFVQAPLAFVGGVVWNYIDIKKERQNIKNAFEHYLPKEVVNQLSKDIAHIQTGSQVVYGVCLFTDAEQYTTLSEVLPPHELGKFMNRYYATMFKPVKQHSGFVSGVIGDSMLALWVAARSEANLKNNACLAALDINEDLKQFKQKSTDTLKLRTRIGLHCGQIMLGHVGALDHYEYTPMGDIVNTASRIEGLNKYLGTTLLVSGDVIHQVNGFLTRDLGAFTLKGKAIPIDIHELVCRSEPVDEKRKTACAVFVEGLGAFRRQSWSEAIEKFNQCIEKLEKDGPSQFYISLCEQFMQNPPCEPWDGVVHMDKK